MKTNEIKRQNNPAQIMRQLEIGAIHIFEKANVPSLRAIAYRLSLGEYGMRFEVNYKRADQSAVVKRVL